MATIRFSPLITEASGSVKDTVFSRWKGRAYIRARVTPSNPQTAAQTLVRESLARTVELWQSTEAQIKAVWDTYASPYSLSGYNSFVSANRAKEQAGTELDLTPPNKDIDKLTTLVASTGTLTKEIDLVWTGGTQDADKFIYVVSRQDTLNAFVLVEKDTTLVSALSVTLTMPLAATVYEIYVADEDGSDSEFSESIMDSATSQT